VTGVQTCALPICQIIDTDSLTLTEPRVFSNCSFWVTGILRELVCWVDREIFVIFA